MTRAPGHQQVPQFDLADRMRKALRHADVGVQEMAEYLEASRNAVGSWINGRNKPSAQTIRLWALRTGVPYEWLRHGVAEVPQPGGGGDAGWAPTGSNRQPADYKVDGSRALVTDRDQAAAVLPFPRRRPDVAPAEARMAAA